MLIRYFVCNLVISHAIMPLSDDKNDRHVFVPNPYNENDGMIKWDVLQPDDETNMKFPIYLDRLRCFYSFY